MNELCEYNLSEYVEMACGFRWILSRGSDGDINIKCEDTISNGND